MRLIDADVIKYREKMECCGHGDYRQLLYVTDDDIAEMPTIDPESLRAKGRWVFVDAVSPNVKCSLCGELAPFDLMADYHSERTNYCPNCGAKMEVEK